MNLNEKPSYSKVRRLVVHQNDGNDFDLGYDAQTPYLRSFLLFVRLAENLDLPMIKSWSNEFTFLRILKLQGCRIGKKMGKEIGGLIHLRYLAIEDCEIEALPSSIGNLRYLQTLIISCQIKLPNVLWKLEQLRHLVLVNCLIKIYGESLKLGNMRELQTLQCDETDFKIWDIGVLVNSSDLNRLGLRIDFGVDEIPSVILDRLSSLSVRHFDLWNMDGSKEGGLEKLFSRCPQPANLTKLALERCYLKEDPMPILEKFPNLRILRFKWDSFMGTLLVCSPNGFPKLQTLSLSFLSNLSEWRVEEEAMPNLSHLHIHGCPKLKMILEGIKFITTLRHLEISRMYKEFEDRVRGDVDGREGEDFYKIRHVPSIIIRNTYLFR